MFKGKKKFGLLAILFLLPEIIGVGLIGGYKLIIPETVFITATPTDLKITEAKPDFFGNFCTPNTFGEYQKVYIMSNSKMHSIYTLDDGPICENILQLKLDE